MKTSLLHTIILFGIIVLINSCKKNDIGGDSTIEGTVMHHTMHVPNAYIYIKYNTKDFPGDDYKLYDTYVKADKLGHFHIKVYPGDYYLYAKGYDYSVTPPLCKGGIPITIRDYETLTKTIAVVE